MDARGTQVDVEALAGRSSGGDGPASSVKVLNINHRLSYQSRRHVAICISDMALSARDIVDSYREGIGAGLSACTTPACGNSFAATALFFSWPGSADAWSGMLGLQ
jgi:hypothetical protein